VDTASTSAGRESYVHETKVGIITALDVCAITA
jgi:hypothetical protein